MRCCAFWRPRFVRAAAGSSALEARRRQALSAAILEIRGTLEFDGAWRRFRACRRAPTASMCCAAGGAAIIDYKTGDPPSAYTGAANARAAIAARRCDPQAGGFEGVAPLAPRDSSISVFRRRRGGHAHRQRDVGKLIPSQRQLAAHCRIRSRRHGLSAPHHAASAAIRRRLRSLARVREWSLSAGEDETNEPVVHTCGRPEASPRGFRRMQAPARRTHSQIA